MAQSVRRGLGWSFISSIATRVGTVLSGIVLARLLSPADYGQFTVALVVLLVLANINDLGLEATLVRWPGAIDEIAPTATTIIFSASCLLAGGVFVGAPAIAAALNAPDAAGIVRLMAVSVVVNGLFAVPSAILTRSFMQGRRATADLTGMVVTLGLSVVLAVMGFGAWSLAWGRFAGNGVNSVLLWWFAPARYRPGWSRAAARHVLAGGLPIAGTLLLAVGLMNVDYVVVGRLLDPAELGLYLLAFNLSSWPVSILSVAVARISVPAFARLQHDLTALRAAFRRSLTLIMAPTVLVAVMLAVYALPATRVVYGPRWSAAAAALSFLAVLGALRVAMQFAADLLTAAGKARLTLVIQGGWIIALLPALVIGVTHAGIRGAGIAHVAVALCVAVPAHLAALATLRISPLDVLRSAGRPVAAGAAAALVAVGVQWLIADDLATLVVGGLAGAAVFAVVARPILRLVSESPADPRSSGG
ncbi:oligosaccharide flippase family protein [Planosporangium flavigriseum]|uniref:Polysaccharide biosynthesis protein n=1 Tax=Planosporangium flavigriseum TaxID=373681 RepID=A0A8J3LLR4_9ACTN|nr:oligosaccharide flippase family protein [Planosporangium flavigriseum]NJC65795.1 oligosaccharide flippase family protein [Planosporangium flavigriseum]GIG73649.1 polysaccharide biosynthesis protein [Planosporangium flavigriseum]